MRTVIVLPTYNEKENIGKLIKILEDEVFPQIKNVEMGILVADDSSPDGTAQTVAQLMKSYKNLDLTVGKKVGLGAAYVRGMTYAIEKMDADVLCEMDADFSHDPNKIPEFLKKIDEGYDMVIGTRYSAGGSIPQDWGLDRKLYSILGNLLVRFIMMRFYIHDWTGGFRVFRKDVFLKERDKLLKIQGYTFQIAFLHRAIQDGFTVCEVPFHFIDRTKGKSKIPSQETIIATLTYVFRQRAIELIHSPFLKYAITGFLGYIINATSLELFYHLGYHPAVAGTFGAELSIIWNFIVNNFWGFSAHKITNPYKLLVKFAQFNFVSLGSLFIISTVLYIGTHLFGEEYRQVFLAIAIGFLVIPYSYSMYNIFIWKRWHIGFLSGWQKRVG